jgi:hypothetical protein
MAQQTIAFDGRRLVLLLISAGVMFASACSVVRWLGTVAAISGWIGLAQHEDVIPSLRVQAGVWKNLALALPLVAAAFLFAARRRSINRNDATGFVWECTICLVAAILGTSAFLFCLFVWAVLLSGVR